MRFFFKKAIFSALVVLSSNIYSQQSPWGVAAHPLRAEEWSNVDASFNYVCSAGITWIRDDFRFSTIYRSDGEFNYTPYDQLLEKAEQYGIKILPILEGYDNELRSKHSHLIPLYEHLEEWRQYVRGTVTRYHKKLKYWEIWNEQDGGFWKPKPDASQYVKLLKIAYEEIKQIDPECMVIVGGLCSWNADYLQSMYNEGAKGYFDILAVHPYNHGLDVNSRALRTMKEFQEVIRKNETREIPIWITECGGTSFTGQLTEQHPNYMIKAIQYALSQIGQSYSENTTIGLAVSPRTKNVNEVNLHRKWLPGVNIKAITYEQLNKLDPKTCPVLIGCEGLNVDKPMLEPLSRYVQKGGLLLAVNKVPFHTVHFQDKTGAWQLADNSEYTYPLFRMNFEAFFTKKELPNYTNTVSTSHEAMRGGLPAVSNIYVDRFLDGKNMKEGDKFHPIIEAYDNNHQPAGAGMALYTYADWKGGVLISTISVDTGFSEDEQANLLHRVYLTYLQAGIEKIFWYDLHNDGALKGEREHNFGLMNNNWTPKKAYYTYQQMTKMLGEHPIFNEKLQGNDTSIWAFVITRSEDKEKVLAIWSTNNTAQATIHYNNGKTAQINLNDNAVQFIPVNNYKSIKF